MRHDAADNNPDERMTMQPETVQPDGAWRQNAMSLDGPGKPILRAHSGSDGPTPPKTSGGMRTLAGAEQFAVLRSYLATTLKRDLSTRLHTMPTFGTPGSSKLHDQLQSKLLLASEQKLDAELAGGS